MEINVRCKHLNNMELPHQPVVPSLFLKYVNLSFQMEFKSDVIKDISSAKMPGSFAAVEVLIEYTFFALSPFLLVLLESLGCSSSFSSC